jgi:hypothetical protein
LPSNSGQCAESVNFLARARASNARASTYKSVRRISKSSVQINLPKLSEANWKKTSKNTFLTCE